MEQEIIAGLVQRGIPPHIAQGMVANMIAESGLNPGINEINPTVEGSRGGFGLNQWTGPRRVHFEQFAASRGSSLDDPNTQLDFTLWELQNTERGAMEALQSAQTPEEAARIYSERFLRPGTPHLDRRIAEATRLAGGQPSNALGQPPAGPQQAPQPQGNALAPQQLAGLTQDPTAFFRQRNALAPRPLQLPQNALGLG